MTDAYAEWVERERLRLLRETREEIRRLLPERGVVTQVRDIMEPDGISMPIAPVPGDSVVMMAASPGEWDEYVHNVEAVLDNGDAGGWLVRIDDSENVIYRGSDGRWWTYGALCEQNSR